MQKHESRKALYKHGSCQARQGFTSGTIYDQIHQLCQTISKKRQSRKNRNSALQTLVLHHIHELKNIPLCKKYSHD